MSEEIFCLIEATESPDSAECLGHGPIREAIATMDPKAPLRLAEAAAVCGLKISALRTEARKGRLMVSRIAGKDHTTLADIERMFELCRVIQKEPGCGSDQLAAMQTERSSKPPTSSRTERDKLALDAALMHARKLKEGSPTTSPANTRQAAANVHYLKSR